jgi:hypothetical protein
MELLAITLMCRFMAIKVELQCKGFGTKVAMVRTIVSLAMAAKAVKVRLVR